MAGMSKRHFEALARLTKDTLAREVSSRGTLSPWSPVMALEAMAYGLADVCARENPQFDKARFLKACGVEG